MKKNYCRADRLISYCTANIRDYLKCKHGVKSSHGDFCMYRDENIRSEKGEDNCRCAEAQKESRAAQMQIEEEIINELKEGEIPT